MLRTSGTEVNRHKICSHQHTLLNSALVNKSKRVIEVFKALGTQPSDQTICCSHGVLAFHRASDGVQGTTGRQTLSWYFLRSRSATKENQAKAWRPGGTERSDLTCYRQTRPHREQ